MNPNLVLVVLVLVVLVHAVVIVFRALVVPHEVVFGNVGFLLFDGVHIIELLLQVC